MKLPGILPRLAVLSALLVAPFPTAPTAAETLLMADFGIVSQDAYVHWSQEADAPLLLDVRTAEEFAQGHIPGATLIPYDQLAVRIGEVHAKKEQPIVIYCKSGRRAGIAADTLAAAGFKDIFLLEGHWTTWTEAGRPVEQ